MAMFNTQQIERIKRLGKRDWSGMKIHIDREKKTDDHRVNILSLITGEYPLIIGEHIPYADIKKYVNSHILSKSDLSQDILDKIYSKEEITQEIIEGIITGIYTDEQIIDFVEDEDYFTKEELKKVIGQEKYDILFPQKEYIGCVFDELPEYTEKGRHDIFILGMAGSGKTSFLAGLFYYGYHEACKLFPQLSVGGGYAYLQELIQAIANSSMVRRGNKTPIQSQYYACDFKSDKGVHPLSFIEMNGEFFTPRVLQDQVQFPSNLKNILFTNENSKTIFLTINSQIKDFGDIMEQNQKVEYFLKLLEQQKVFGSINEIIFLVTKWDKPLESSKEELQNFVNNHYKNIIELCENYKSKYGISLKKMKFSLGEFKNYTTYTYNLEDSKAIFDMLCETTPVTSVPKKTWLSRFLRKKN